MSSASQPPSPDGTSPKRGIPPPSSRITGWHRAVVGAVATVLLITVAAHAGATFFHISPHNAVRSEHGEAIRGYLYPEFRQAWNLFGPELPGSDMRVHARAILQHDDGTASTTEWTDLTVTDLEKLRSSPVPTRARHQLRKGWNDVRRWMDEDGQVHGRQGEDTQQLITRIALERLPVPDGARAQEVQFRGETTAIDPPSWQATTPAAPEYQETPWWSVDDSAQPAGGDRP